MRKRYLYLFAAAFGAAALMSGCSNTSKKDDIVDTNTEKEEDKIYQIYLLAKNSGYEGTYEEWLASIRGDSVELRVNSANIEWKYKQDTNWTTLISLAELTGANGKEVELATSATHITWRYTGETEWNNLLDMSLLTGKSAYDIAKEVGFTGTKEEWLDSLKGRGIKNIEKISSSNGVDTYRITFTDDTTFDYEITNGTNGKSAYEIAKSLGYEGTEEEWLQSLNGKGISKVEKTNSEDGVDTYTITYTDGSTTTYTVTNGEDGSNGESAYDLAKELGFTGTEEEWIQSLNGKGIANVEKTSSKDGVDTYTITYTDDTTSTYTVTNGKDGKGIEGIEKTNTDGNVDTYTITFTDGSTFDFTVTNGTSSQGQTDPVEVPEELYGFSFTEILGYGYALTGTYNLDETVILPDEYNNKPVLQVNTFAIQSEDVTSIIVPDTITNFQLYSIACPYLEAIYYDGSFDSWYKAFGNKVVDLSHSDYDLYFADENGDVIKNGKRYSLLYEATISSQKDVEKYSSVDGITAITLEASILDEKYVDISSFYDLEEIYFDSTLSNWFSINFYSRNHASKLYVLDKNGSIEHNGKTYSEVKELVIPSNYKNRIEYYVPLNAEFESFALLDANLINLYYDSEVLSGNFPIYLVDDYTLITVTLPKNIAMRLYVEDKSGTIVHNGTNFTSYVTLYPDLYTTVNTPLVWDPVKLKDASEKYTAKGSVDAWVTYSGKSMISYNGTLATYQNPIDGMVYTTGDTLPTWKNFASMLGLNSINDAYYIASAKNDSQDFTFFRSTKDDNGQYIASNGEIVDIYRNTLANLNQLADEGELVDLKPYLDNGLMPALKRYLDNNPELYYEISRNGHIYYSPYSDGYQAPEKTFIMDTTQVEKLLDNALPTGTGLLISGASNAGQYPTIVGESSVTPYMDSAYNYPDLTTTIKIVNPKNGKVETVTVNQTKNIIALQNQLLNKTDGSCTGAALIEQFKAYVHDAYGEIIDTYYEGKISKMFTSFGACYNADDLVALLRIFKANPDVLYGSDSLYDEVVPVFCRGGADNRVINILQFAATLYGVQGFDSEYEHLFVGADGKLHDADTQEQSYEMLFKLHDLYSEGLIDQGFFTGTSKTLGYDKYFRKTVDGESTFGLLEYDYYQAICSANDITDKGIGTPNSARRTSKSGYDFSNDNVTGIMPILSPLTYIYTKDYDSQMPLTEYKYMTLQRYYEANRGIGNSTWAVLSSSDNIEAAIALMDLMYTEEGSNVQNFGPEQYWETDSTMTWYDGTEYPRISQTVYNEARNLNCDVDTYYRTYVGSQAQIGNLRPTLYDIQLTNDHAWQGIAIVLYASELGVQVNGRYNEKLSWSTSVPASNYPSIDAQTYEAYAPLTTFWAARGSYNGDGIANNWVNVVVYGKADNVVTTINQTGYTLKEIHGLHDAKNHIYMYQICEHLYNTTSNDLLPKEAQ